MNTDDVVKYVFAVFWSAVWPGPTVTSALSFALRGRRGDVFFYVLGVSLANLGAAVAAGFIRSIGFVLPEPFKTTGALIGACGLSYFGFRLFRLGFASIESPSEIAVELNAPPSTNISAALVAGIGTHLSNPYTVAFYTSAFLSIVPLNQNYIRNVSALAAFAIIVDVVVLTVFSHAGGLFRRSQTDAPNWFALALSYAPICAATFLWLIAVPALLRAAVKLVYLIYGTSGGSA